MDFTFIDDARRCKRLGNSYPKSLVLIFNFNDEKTLFWAYPYQNGVMYALIVANVCHPSNPLRISAPANLCVKNKGSLQCLTFNRQLQIQPQIQLLNVCSPVCVHTCNHTFMLFAGWEVHMVKNCDRGLENAALGLRPRAAFSQPQSQFFTIRTDLSWQITCLFFRAVNWFCSRYKWVCLRNFVIESAGAPSRGLSNTPN